MCYILVGRLLVRDIQLISGWLSFVGCYPSDCNREITSERNTRNGTFSSPYFPGSCPVDITCKYTFKGRVHERVQIIFADINLLDSFGSTTSAECVLFKFMNISSPKYSIFQDQLHWHFVYLSIYMSFKMNCTYNKTGNIGNVNSARHLQRHSTLHAMSHRNSRKRAEYYTDGIAGLNGDGDALEQEQSFSFIFMFIIIYIFRAYVFFILCFWCYSCQGRKEHNFINIFIYPTRTENTLETAFTL